MPFTLLDLRGAGLDTLYAAPLALVRPDQFVAWRGANANVAMLIRTISGQELNIKSKAQSNTQSKQQILAERLGRVAS